MTDMPSKVRDLAGRRFGRLVVRSFAGFVRNGSVRAAAWDCLCDCGESRRSAGVELARGRITSCGCQSPNALKDLTGKRFGAWTVLQRIENAKGGRTIWRCLCDCGTKRAVHAEHLHLGKSRSCGCVRPTGKDNPRYRHGQSKRAGGLYPTWRNIIQRCENPNNGGYADYGARGISVCGRWRADFQAFVADMGPRPSSRHTIERRSNDGNYEPDNYRWATRVEQGRNKRSNRLVRYRGSLMPLSQAVELAGINYGTAQWRLNNGRSDEGALR